MRKPILIVCALLLAFVCSRAQEPTDTLAVIDSDTIFLQADSLMVSMPDTVAIEPPEPVRVFNPDPTRATWLSVLCPGLGQLYNRRFWKLPIVVGAYMGLIYATSWNNTMLTDYTTAYNDLMDNDPSTTSYMNFFAPGVSESQLNHDWLQRTFQSRKNYFRRNRDLCIVGMIGVYLVAIIDAYVDASLAHFDISPDLSLEWSPTFFNSNVRSLPSFGLQWALSF